MEVCINLNKLPNNLLDNILIKNFTFNELIQISKFNLKVSNVIKRNFLFKKYIEFNFSKCSLKDLYFEMKNLICEDYKEILIYNC